MPSGATPGGSAAQARSLLRQNTLPVSMLSQCGVNRARNAGVILARAEDAGALGKGQVAGDGLVKAVPFTGRGLPPALNPNIRGALVPCKFKFHVRAQRVLASWRCILSGSPAGTECSTARRTSNSAGHECRSPLSVTTKRIHERAARSWFPDRSANRLFRRARRGASAARGCAPGGYFATQCKMPLLH